MSILAILQYKHYKSLIFSFQIIKRFLFLTLEYFCIYVRRDTYITMYPYILANFYICFILTEPCTKCMSQVMH